MVLTLFADTIVRLRPGSATDAYGNPVRDWTAASSATLTGVAVQPATGRAETADGIRDTAVSRWLLFTPIGSGDLDLLATDRVVYDGMTLEVDGEVSRWPDPLTGGVSKVEATLRRAVDQ